MIVGRVVMGWSDVENFKGLLMAIARLKIDTLPATLRLFDAAYHHHVWTLKR